MKNSDFSYFHNEKICRYFLDRIEDLNNGENTCFMEVCGTHTQAFFKYGLKSLIPENIRLISGPGCPVCVTPNERIDKIIACSKDRNNIVSTFGDLYRVPGSASSLEKEKASGANIIILYSPAESLDIAQKNPDKKVIFFGVGFETTLPVIAVTLLEAKKRNLKNWLLFSAHKIIPPAMEVLVKSSELNLNGFMCPGHVSAIIGSKPYRFIAEDYKIPCVITGFEPVDILQGICMLLQQHVAGENSVEIQYRRAVREEGNKKAVELLQEVFEPADSVWRGIGNIPASGMKLKNEYSDFNAEQVIKIDFQPGSKEPSGCICGEILRGIKNPSQCRLFRKKCNPENPVGACMVSSEGACAVYYRYG